MKKNPDFLDEMDAERAAKRKGKKGGLSHDYEVKDDGSMTDKEAKALMIRGVRVALDALDRQSKAFAEIAAAATLYAKTDAEYDPSESDKTKQKYLDEIMAKASQFFDKIAGEGRHEPTAEEKAAREKAKKIAAKRLALVSAQWNKTEKPKHGADCEFQACVCPLFLAEGNRAFLQAQGLPTAFAYPGAGLSGLPADYEVRS